MNNLVTDNMGLTMLENEEMLSIYGGNAYSSGHELGRMIRDEASEFFHMLWELGL